jgi:hypothetical protein
MTDIRANIFSKGKLFLNFKMTQRELLNIIENETYSLIDVSTNKIPNNVQKYKVFTDLLHEYIFYPVFGRYNGINSETALFIVKPREMKIEVFYFTMINFGKQFEQESLIISSCNVIELIFPHSAIVKTAYGYEKFDLDNDYAIINPNTASEIKLGKFHFESL